MMITRNAVAAAHATILAPAAALIRAQQVVRLADFREATAYPAICPDCHQQTMTHGYATTRPPLCGCGTRMMKA